MSQPKRSAVKSNGAKALQRAAFNTQADKGVFAWRAIGGVPKAPIVQRETLKAELARKFGTAFAERVYPSDAT